MNNENDDDYIHPLLETILMKAMELEIHSRYRREDGTVGHRHHPDAEKAKLLYEAIDRFYLEGQPYLADKAKAKIMKSNRWKRAAIRLWQQHPCCSHSGKDDNLDAIEASLMIEKETP